MTYFFSVLVFLVIFSILVLIHELGHYLFAKKAGIKVEEFGLGLPPKIWGKKYGETEFSLNWIPFGGFVRLFGEDSADPKILKNKRSFAAQSVRDRILVIIGGVAMNFLLAWLLLVVGFSVGMKPIILPDKVLPAVRDGVLNIETVKEGTPGAVEFPRLKVVGSLKEAEGLGFRENDVLLSVNGREIFVLADLDQGWSKSEEMNVKVWREGRVVEFLMKAPFYSGIVVTEILSNYPANGSGIAVGDEILSVNDKIVDTDLKVLMRRLATLDSDADRVYEVLRGEQILKFKIRPASDGRIGVLLAERVNYMGFGQNFSLEQTSVPVLLKKVEEVSYPVPQSVVVALREMWDVSKLTALMFVDFVKDFFSTGQIAEGVSGPVGIFQMTHVSAQEGLMSLIRFTALLSLSLAVINILPFPALDGGRLFFIFLEVLWGRRLSHTVEARIHGAGYLLLLVLIIAVTFSDIWRLLV